MASLALDSAYRRVSVNEFLRMDFGDAKAELIKGVIFMMAGADARHNLVSTNVAAALRLTLRGTGCRPYGSDQAVQTSSDTVRYPDVSVFCGAEAFPTDSKQMLLGIPRTIVEVLSPSTAINDQREKLVEYRALDGLDCILFVDPETERVRRVAREGSGWTDLLLDCGSDVELATLGITLTAEDIFARD
jgi:Uma2 family endonuclease